MTAPVSEFSQFVSFVETRVGGFMSQDNPSVMLKWKNAPFSAVQGTPYIYTSVMGESTHAVSLGRKKISRNVGLINFDVYYPSETGARAAESLRDALVYLFRYQDFLLSPGLVVRCHGGHTTPGSLIDPWFRAVGAVAYERDVFIPYRAAVTV